MKSGFYTIIAAQFFSSCADSALLVAAIALLQELREPDWMTPVLKQALVVPYVILAPLAGAHADAKPKGRVMMISNAVKLGGCAMMLFLLHPLLAYAVVGVGAALYSPAKYGILTELLPPGQLVAANGWMEGTTVASIILGVSLGGILISPRVGTFLLQIDVPFLQTGITTPPQAAMAAITGIYLFAALLTGFIPNTGVDHRIASRNPQYLLREFSHCVALLWKDRLAQLSLATTTLFWGAAATLQLVVIEWASRSLGLDLSRSTWLMGVVTLGIAVGAMLAARLVSLRGAVRVLPIGMLMGLAVIAMIFVHSLQSAVLMMLLIGACAGFFVVPMNALLQHRGHLLMGAGHSIAVQNFNENIGILVMVGLYALLLRLHAPVATTIVLFGLLIMAAMALVIWRHRVAPVPADVLGNLAAGRSHDA
jgi:MFS family permease